MKKFVIAVSAFCITLTISAQDLITKVPSTASAVVSIKGENLLQLMNLEEFSDSKFGSLLEKELSKETDGKLTTLEDIGIDYNNTAHYFFEMKDNVFTNCFLIPLQNSNGIANSFSERDQAKIVKEASLSYLHEERDDLVLMWNDTLLVFVIAIDNSIDEDYYGYDYQSEIGVEEKVYDSIEEEEAAYKKEREEKEKLRLEREEKRLAKREAFKISTLENAKKILAGTYASKSILTNKEYLKSLGKGNEEASVWVNDLGTIYQQAIPSYMYGNSFNPYSFMNIEKMYGGLSVMAKLDFKEDEVVLKTEYTMNDEMADLYKPMYNGKMNKNFTKYINEDDMLGYMSLNLSTEGLLTAYPNLASSLFDTGSGETISESVALGAKVLSLLIDEEGTSKILRGDMFLALTNLSEKQVTYTDYEYDEDFNYTEIEKTKTETVPDFLFMFTSEEKEIFTRIMRIGIKEKQLEAKNGLFQFIDMPKSTPFNMYVMYKDNTVIFGSSLKDMTAIQKGTYVSKLSSEHKKNIIKNASSVYVNGKKIMSEIPEDSFPRELRNKVDFLTSNTEDIKFNFQKIKGNSMKGELIWQTSEDGHKNSLAYFINMIDAIMD